MTQVHGPAQLLEVKRARRRSQAKARAAEIDRIGAVSQRSFHFRKVTGRSQKFHFFHCKSFLSIEFDAS
jgi:hypothetical protein